MGEKVTIQDIADALGLSRNTVSKAINNTGILADATRERILAKAAEMGYKNFSYMPLADSVKAAPHFTAQRGKEEIALLTGMFLGNSHFASTMLDKVQREISAFGFHLTIHRVLSSDRKALTLPSSFEADKVAGIMCIEIFDYNYCKMVCDLGLPVLMVDAPVSTYGDPLPADIILMDNSAAIYQLISRMKKKGYEKIGFIGEATHCRSFFERFMAFRNAMYLYDMPIEEQYCLTEIHLNTQSYTAYLYDQLKQLNHMPDLWICANDFIAIDVLQQLKKLNCYCPDDCMVCGFDDSPDSKIFSPKLTTVHIHSQITGFSAVNLLLSRIEQPDLNYRTTYTETNLIIRESTDKLC